MLETNIFVSPVYIKHVLQFSVMEIIHFSCAIHISCLRISTKTQEASSYYLFIILESTINILSKTVKEFQKIGNLTYSLFDPFICSHWLLNLCCSTTIKCKSIKGSDTLLWTVWQTAVWCGIVVMVEGIFYNLAFCHLLLAKCLICYMNWTLNG